MTVVQKMKRPLKPYEVKAMIGWLVLSFVVVPLAALWTLATRYFKRKKH